MGEYWKARLNYFLRARHRGGHSIHSPFLFGLLTNVIENFGTYYAYAKMEKELKRDSNLNQKEADGGISGTSFKGNAQYDLPLKYGKLVFRLANEFKCRQIFVAGPTSGMNLLFCGMHDSSAEIQYFSKKYSNAVQIEERLSVAGIKNYTVISDFVEKSEAYDLGFINLVEPLTEMSGLIDKLLTQMSGNGLLCIQGIHQNRETEGIWQTLLEREECRICLDFLKLGIIILRPDLQKENFVIRF